MTVQDWLAFQRPEKKNGSNQIETLLLSNQFLTLIFKHHFHKLGWKHFLHNFGECSYYGCLCYVYLSSWSKIYTDFMQLSYI